jgi:hypothetical protein
MLIESFYKGRSYYFVLKDNGGQAIATGGTHWLGFLPNHMYCFLPSYEVDKGQVEVFDYIPEFLKDFLFCMEIEQVLKNTFFLFFILNLGCSIF